MEFITDYQEAKRLYYYWLKAIEYNKEWLGQEQHNYLKSIKHTAYSWNHPNEECQHALSFCCDPDKFDTVQFNLYQNQSKSNGILFAEINSEKWILRKSYLTHNNHTHGVTHKDFEKSNLFEFFKVDASASNPFLKVANLGKPSQVIAKQTSKFIENCNFLRHQKIKTNIQNNNISTKEDSQATEHQNHGPKTISSKGHKVTAKENKSVHTAISKALKDYVNDRGGTHKMYKYIWESDGADIENKISYEIKTSASANDIQTAVGQLFLYEKIIAELSGFIKTIVLPDEPSQHAIEALKEIDVAILIAKRVKNGYKFFPYGR